MFEYEGNQYTLADLQTSATKQGYENFDEFLQAYKDAGLKEVSAPTTMGSDTLGAPLAGGSMEQQEGKVVKKIDTSTAGLFFNTLQQVAPGAGKPLAALASLAKGTVDIVDNIGDAAETFVELEFGGGFYSGGGLPKYMAKRIAAQKAGVTLEEYDEQNPYNILELKSLSNAIDKATIKYKDKETGQQLDYTELFSRGEYSKATEAFVYETAGALPSMFVSRVPGGYAMLGAGAFAEKLNTDLFERPDQTAEKILSNALIYGGSDAVGEYFGGRYLNKLGGLVKGGGKAGLDKAKDVMIGGVGAFVKTAFKGGSNEFMQEAITSVIQTGSDEIIYGDEKSGAEYFRKAVHAGLIGFALGGGSGTASMGMDKANKTKFYEYLAPKSYKKDRLDLKEKEVEAQEDLDKAPADKKQKFQERLDNIKKKGEDLQAQLYDWFETTSENDPNQIKLMIAKIQEKHDALDVITGGNDYSNAAKEQAKKDFKDADDVIGNLFAVTDINYDAKFELDMSKFVKAAEEIDEANKSLWFKSKDLKYEYVDTQEKFDELKKKYGKDVANSADGFFDVTVDGQKKIFINRDVAASASATNVIGHELLHYALSNRFANDPKYLRDSVVAFKDYIKQLDNGDYILKSIESRLANPENGYAKLDANGKVQKDKDGLIVMSDDSWIEEYFTMFTDLIKTEKIDVVEGASKGLANTLRTTVRGLGLGFNKVDFKSGQEVFKFLIDYNKNIGRKGLVGAITQKKAIKQAAGKGVKKADVGTKKSVTDSKGPVDDLGKMGWTDKTWKDSGATFAIETIKDEKLLDALIYAKYKVEDVPANFVNDVITALTPDIKKFNSSYVNKKTGKKVEAKWGTEQENDSLFGYLQGLIQFRADDVYKELYKGDDAIKGAKNIGETTKEGEVKIQVAAETDAAVTAFESEDLSPAAQAKKKADKAKGKEKVESKFRRQIGIETGSDLYNKVLDTARKSLLRAYEAGTSVRNIQRKLRDEANVYLFKDIKNFLGTTKYISNLKEFRVPIMNSIFTADLVQMERNTPEGERVFTRFVRKLTSKADVQAAVDQNLLPASALNIIDKGTAVSLYEKANPTEAQFMSYFDIPTINPKTGARSGTRGTRKDQLAKNMAGALSYDATMEVAQEPEIAQKRADLAELRGESLLADDISQLAAAINRNPSVKFSYSQKQFDQGISIIEGNNKNDGFGGVNWNNFFNNPDISNDTKNAAQEAYAQRLTEQNDAISNKDLAKYDFTDPKRNGSYTGKPRKRKLATSKKYELYAKEKMQEALKNAGLDAKVYKVEKLSEKDNNPDIRVTRSGKTIFTVEIKGNTARGVSVSFNYKQDGKGLAKNKKAASKNETSNYLNEESSLIKTTNKVFEKMINLVGEDNVRYTNQKNLQISVEGVKKIKEAGLQLLVHKKQVFITTADFVNSYKEKKGKDGSSRTSNAIDIGNAGMFLMDSNSEMKIEGLKSLVDQKVLIPLTARISFNLNTAKTHYTVSVRVEPQINSLLFEKQNISLINKSKNKNIKLGFSKSQQTSVAQDIIKAANKARTVAHFSKTNGASIFDFDETVGISENFIIAKKGNVTEKITSDEWPLVGETLREQGYDFDFTDFNKVTKGKPGPLLQKMKNQIEKYGPKNVFILTARAPESQTAIHEWLESEGVNIPVENITGLGDSTGEAKAAWVLDKYANNNYNDIYFVDDALQNVKAVKNMLDQLDIKGKSVQAKIKFSKSMNEKFNDILENVTGIGSVKKFSEIKGRKRGDDKGKFRLFIPPSHEDFVGLLYNFMGKGKEGNKHRDFFEQALVRPINRAYREIDTAKQAIANDYKELNKQFPEIKDKLIKTTPDGDFNFSDAIRVYLWTKHGHKIPGLTETDQAKLTELVQSDPQLQAYAETLNTISKQETYVAPGQAWEMGNIRIDLVDATGRVGRAEYFSEFQENAEVIFSEENLNKIEAGYGKDFRSALEDMLHRIKTGVNRPKGESGKPNAFMNWLNASVAGVMFFNTRSALLQQMSNVNYLNFADNNILAAGKAFANQPQYWKDFAMIFNSDMLKQRRGGLGTDINGAELAEAIKKARPDSMFDQVAIITGKALKLGFLPTQIGDNIAIATGGAAFYRNRVNKYVKDGMSIKEAENAAFTDFQNITQSTQQSARPDMTSQQQASWIGKLVLNFLNTPSQYNRIIKKAGLDIKNRRITGPNTSQIQSDMSNMSRILYYGAAQNLIFYSLQTALFAVMFGDDEDEEALLKKKERVINGSIDTILRGSGIFGVAISTLKNMAIKFMEQREKGYNKDESAVALELANFSPVLGIKFRRIVNAEKTINYNGKVIEEMETFDLDNPAWSAVTNYTQSLTGAPVNKIYQKTINLRNASDNQYTALQRILFLSGYTTWSLNLGDTEKMEQIKEDLKAKKKKSKKKKSILGKPIIGKRL